VDSVSFLMFGCCMLFYFIIIEYFILVGCEKVLVRKLKEDWERWGGRNHGSSLVQGHGLD